MVLECQLTILLSSEKFGVVLRTCESSSEDLEALEIVHLIEVLAKGSSEDLSRAEMLKEDELLISAIGKFVVIISNSGDELEGNQNAFLADLLKNLHTLGKSGTNYFSTVKDYFAPLEDHPALNLKNHLVRLLGNLCYQNRAIQDRLRTEEVIPTLLECSQLDSRNKLIKEWSVQVIRHLCEDNLENQELIKSYVRVGVTQPPILEDLGLSVDVSDSGLKLHAAEREN